jgi:hypothetical protein
MNGALTISLLVLTFSGAALFLLPYFAPRRFFFTITDAHGLGRFAAGVGRPFSMPAPSVVLLRHAGSGPRVTENHRKLEKKAPAQKR